MTTIATITDEPRLRRVPGAYGRVWHDCRLPSRRLWRRQLESPVEAALDYLRTAAPPIEGRLPWNLGAIYSGRLADYGLSGAMGRLRLPQRYSEATVCPSSGDVAAVRRHFRRIAGWLRAIPDYPAVAYFCRQTVCYAGQKSPYTFSDLLRVAGRHPSPGRFGSWLRSVRWRAALILRPWGIAPSWRAVAVVAERGRRRPHKAAIQVAALTLFFVAGRHVDLELSMDAVLARPVRLFLALRRYLQCRRLPGDITLSTPAEGLTDDGGGRVVAAAPTGTVYAMGGSGIAARECRVVVRDATSGETVVLLVPRLFAAPLLWGETASQRVRAALAWTFGVRPDAYRPAIET